MDGGLPDAPALVYSDVSGSCVFRPGSVANFNYCYDDHSDDGYDGDDGIPMMTRWPDEEYRGLMASC